MQTTTTHWDHSVDVLIVGSGAGAMTAAVIAHDRGAQTLLIEKSDRYGGSSAMSGGGVWVPNNHLMAGIGITDTPDDAWSYLKAATAGVVPDDRLRAYLEYAPVMARYLVEQTRLRLVPLPVYADYCPTLPGCRPGGRSLEPERFDAAALGDEFDRLQEQNAQMLIMGRVFMTIVEARTLLGRTPGWARLTLKLLARYWGDVPWRLRSKRDRHLTMGNALVGMLRRSLMDRDVPLWLRTPARELVVDGGRVVGVVTERDGRPLRIHARRGVILAAGGFEANQAMRERYLPHPTRAEWSCANPHNTGDAITLGLAAGAGLDLMADAWWGPVTRVPGEPLARMLIIEKSLPGSILVNRQGKRFVNECSTYADVVGAMYASDSPEAPAVPAYLVFDATYRRKYPCGPVLPGTQQPDWAVPARLRHYFKKAGTVAALAAQLGIDAPGLAATVARVNEYARTGVDLEFHRGDTDFERYYGDPHVTPNPCLAPIETPPYYGLEAYPGDLGTKGGLQTDACARVLTPMGNPIAGLYAIGNCAASVMGHSYPGAGATIGPAMTFGYIAACDAVPGRHSARP